MNLQIKMVDLEKPQLPYSSSAHLQIVLTYAMHDDWLRWGCEAELNAYFRFIMLLLGQSLTEVDFQGSNGGLPPNTHSLQH